MTPNMLAAGIQQQNALLRAATPQAQAPQLARRTPLDMPVLLANTIGHAALLSDTPEKWASTIAMLRRNGIDPEHYADFEKGRPAAMTATGTSGPEWETE